MAWQHQVCCTCLRRFHLHRCHGSCTLLIACALPGINHRRCWPRALRHPFLVCRRGCWLRTASGALHTSPCQSALVSCARRAFAQTIKQACFLNVFWVCVGARPRFVAQFVRAWARLHAQQENGHVCWQLNDRVCRTVFVCRVVGSRHTMPHGTRVACRA